MTTGGETNIAALFARVRARPDDEDARRVLGDALVDAGDPLGTLITRETDTWDPDERLIAYATLLPRLLADLYGHIEPRGFRLGFLDAARDLGTAPLDSPTWATVRNLETERPELVRAAAPLDRLSTRFEVVRAMLFDADPVPVQRLWPIEVDLPAALDDLPGQPGAWAEVTHVALTTTSDEPRPELYAVAAALLGCGLRPQVLRVETRDPPPVYLRRRFAEVGGLRLEWRGEGLDLKERRYAIATGPPVPHHPPVPLPTAVAGRVVGRHSTGRYVVHADGGPVLWQWPVPDNLLRPPDARGAHGLDEGLDLGRRRRVGFSIVNEVGPAVGPGPAPWPEVVHQQVERAVHHARRRVPRAYRLAETALEAFAMEGGRGRLLAPRLHPRPEPDRIVERLRLRGRARLPWAGITVTARPAVDALSNYGAHPDGVFAIGEGLGGRPRAELAASVVVSALAAPGELEERFDDAKQRLLAIANPRQPEWYLGVSALRLEVGPTEASLGWLGEIGAIHLSGDSLTRIARGHPTVERWIDEGMMMARGTWSPYAVQVSRSLTPGDQGRLLRPTHRQIPIAQGDRFVLVTAGLSRVIDDPTLHGIALAHRSQSARALATALARAMGELSRDESASLVVVDIK
ncbi:MAG: hypothetical protein AAGA48_27300 [Myxococcota bacterium]